MRTFVTLILVLVLLAIFNPTPDAFEQMVEKRASEMVAGEAGEVGGGKFGALLGNVTGAAAANTLMRVTERKNYYVASVYTIDLDGIAGTANEWKFLGIATQFIELQRPAALGGK
ncbi:MAG: DUF4359 domain-containing protein [Rhodothermales bacterium]|nr:DUF4359 domain-containing protein [Rhodothermales bacterium]